MGNRDAQKKIKFYGETIEYLNKTIVKIMRKVANGELKKFKKYYTTEVLNPALSALKAEIISEINVSTSSSFEVDGAAEEANTDTEVEA